MHSKYFRSLAAGTMLLLAMLACNTPNLPGVAVQAPSTNTATRPVPTFTPTQAASPTETLTSTPAVTVTMTLTPEPSVTPTEAVVMGVVNKQSNCRSGPGAMYDLITVYQAKISLQIVARDLGGGYVYVQNPDKPEEACWILQTSIDTIADLSPLPAFTPPPSPTAAPSFTVTFKNYDICSSSTFTRFVVVNTGSVPFRSAYIKVTNTKNGEVTQQTVNAFDLTVGCVVAQNIAPLNPGQTGFLQSAPFQKNPRGMKLFAIIQVCTEQDQKGICVNQTLNISGK